MEKVNSRKKDDANTIRCENCASKVVYFRLKTKQIVCRRCGFISVAKDETGEKGTDEKAADKSEIEETATEEIKEKVE